MSETAEEIITRAIRDRNVKLRRSRFHNPNPPGPLYWWQETQATVMVGRKEHFEGDITGLGKSATALVAYAVLKEVYPDLKLWVLTTKSGTGTWEEEVPKWTQDLITMRAPSEVVTLSSLPQVERHIWRGLSSTAFRDKYSYHPWRDHGDILITNYVQAREDFPAILQLETLGKNLDTKTIQYQKTENTPARIMVICDEATAFKGEETALREAICVIRTHAERFYELSATIVKNGLIEARSLLDVMNKNICPKSVFETHFCTYKKVVIRGRGGRKMRVTQLAGYKNIDTYKKLIAPWYLGYRDDEPDIAALLPKILNKTISIDLPQLNQRVYNAIEDMVLDPEWGKEMTPLTKLLYTQFCVNGTQLLDGKFPAITGTLNQLSTHVPPKIAAIDDLMKTELSGEGVVIYSQYETSVTMMQTWLEKLGYRIARVTGTESDEERTLARTRLDSKEIDALLIDDAGGESINLQSAKALIFFDFPWSAGQYIQIVGRVRRLNAPDKVKWVYHLTGKDTVDEYKWLVLDRKFQIIEKLYKGRGNLLQTGEITPQEVLAEMRKRKRIEGDITQMLKDDLKQIVNEA